LQKSTDQAIPAMGAPCAVIPERVAGFGDAGGDYAGIQPGLLGGERAEHLIRHLARYPLVPVGDAIGDGGGVGIWDGGDQ
jgi:hypothetical protein